MAKAERVKPKYKKPGRKSKRPIKYEFDLNYYELGRSAAEMAEKYGVKENTIYQWAMQFRAKEGGGKRNKNKIRELA